MRLLVALLLVACSGCQEQKETLKPAKAIWAFQATWCGPCHQMDPVLTRLQAKGYRVRRIDVDQNPELARAYKVKSLPTFVILRNGKEVDRAIGVVPEKRLIRKY